MISVVEHSPTDPPSSNYQNHHHHQQQDQEQQVTHEALASVSDIDLLNHTVHAANLDDTNNQLPNFSIRDYVYGSRFKNIACNWPFSHKSLQLCLLHGVKNILPPFESLDSLRTNCVDANRLRNEVNLSCFDGKSTNGQSHIEEDLAYAKSSKSTPASQKMVKKCKFVMKLNSGVDPVQEVNPNNFIVSETMASKVCPVCKTFSSSSNTTLNAHIDRCLSEESSMKPTANQKITVKHRIKPRTTRLLVDIYKTAPHCTIEELDRRNGTSWATNSSFPDQELEFQAEKETKEEPKQPTFVPEVADRDGAVYIDKNGKKVRILSMPTFKKLDDREARKLHKRGKASKIIAENKKKKKKAFVKNLKPSTNSKKATSGQEENVGVEDSCNKDESDQPMKARVSAETDDFAITRPPWACSLRTSSAKKMIPALTKPKEGVDPSVIGSKEIKFPSLEKNLSKLNLKRKVSVLETSRHQCLSIEDNVTAPSQNTLEKKSRLEEYTDEKLSSEMVCVLDVEKKNSVNGVPFQGSFTGIKNHMDDEFSDQYLDDNVMIEHNTEDLMDPLQKDGDYFVEVDPIPIPGPPGSFLPPSPGADMVSEELQGNSSLTTMSRVHSSEDQNHHDVMNHDFITDSPISTISNAIFAKSSENFSLAKKKSMNIDDLRPVDAEKGPYLSAFNRQESSEQDLELNRRGNSMNFRSDLFPLTLLPPQTVKSSADAPAKFPDYRYCESVSPTTPVLRLMGKNLTVVNTDDEQFRPPPSPSPLNPRIKNVNDNSFFYGHSSQHYIDFSQSQSQNGSVAQNFNLRPPDNSTYLSQSRPVNELHTMFPSARNGPTKELIVIDDSSENEGDDHMSKGQMRRNLASSSFFNPMHNWHGFGNHPHGHRDASPVFREVVNNGNLERWVSTETGSSLPYSTAYQELMKLQVYR
ncbi:uncharacterized protein [Rutidosis leptorrhynchoides]|uniref:uncharacterized protein n=1 Tax=Rutidosis leptorrhynchoides TaxID=125765 RepID=UPI003A997A43